MTAKSSAKVPMGEPSRGLSRVSSALLRTSLMLAALTPFAYAFWYTSSSVGRFEVPRFTLLMLTGVVALLFVASGPPMPANALRADPWFRGLAAVSAVSVVSALLSAQPAQLLTFGAEKSFMGVPVWLTFALVASVVSLPETRRFHRVVVQVLVLGAVVSALVAISERVGRDEFSGMLGNGNYVGTFLVAVLPLSVMVFWAARKMPSRVAWAAAMLVVVGGVILAQSATVYAVLAAQVLAVAAFAPQLAGISSPTGRMWSRRAAAAAAAAAAVLVVVWRAVPQLLPSALTAALDREIVGPTLISRMAHWRVAWDVFVQRPLLGAGPDGIDAASQAVITQQFVTAGPVVDGVSMLLRDPHSLPLLILASSGLVGLGAAVYLVWAWVSLVRHGVANASGKRRDAVILLAISTASFFACLLLIPWTVRYGALPALIAGMTVAAARAGATHSLPQSEALRPGVAVRVASGVLAACCLGLGIGAWVSQAAIVNAQGSLDLAAAATHTRRATAVAPTRLAAWDEHLEVVGEQMASGVLKPEELRAVYDRAPAMFQDYAPYEAKVARVSLDYVMRFGGPGDHGLWAIERAEHALQLAPALPQAQSEAARATLLRGDPARARALLDQADEVGYKPSLISSYRAQLPPQ